MKVETKKQHAEPADFQDDVGTTREVDKRSAPLRKNVASSIRVRSHAQWCADVIENDRRLGKTASKIGQHRYLMMKQPCIECHPKRRELSEACAETRIDHAVGSRAAHAIVDVAAIPDQRIADSAKATLASRGMRLQRFADGRAECQIQCPHNACA